MAAPGKQFVEILANKQGRSTRGPVILHGVSSLGPQQAHLRALGLNSVPLHQSNGLLPVRAATPDDSRPFNTPRSSLAPFTTIDPRHEMTMIRNGQTLARLALEAESDVPALRGYNERNTTWYPRGREHAVAIGRMLGHGDDTAHEVGAGVLAALSGNGTDWDTANVPAAYAVAKHAVENRRNLSTPAGLRETAQSFVSSFGVEGDRVHKALQIARASGPEDHYTKVLGDAKEGTFADNLAYPDGDSPHRDGPIRSTIDKQYYDALTAYKRPWSVKKPDARRPWDPTPTDINMGLGTISRFGAMNRVAAAVGRAAGALDDRYSNPINAQSGIWVGFKDLHDPRDSMGEAFQNYVSHRFPDFATTMSKFGSRRPDPETGLVYRDNPQQKILSRRGALDAGIISARA